jgi:hypothetical protein
VASLPHYPAIVRVDPAILPWIRSAWRYARIKHEDPPDAEGWIKLSVEFEVEEEACQYALSSGPQIEVLEPQALREKVIDLAKGVLEIYAQSEVHPKSCTDLGCEIVDLSVSFYIESLKSVVGLGATHGGS